jgi:hypothetical protein
MWESSYDVLLAIEAMTYLKDALITTWAEIIAINHNYDNNNLSMCNLLFLFINIIVITNVL